MKMKKQTKPRDVCQKPFSAPGLSDSPMKCVHGRRARSVPYNKAATAFTPRRSSDGPTAAKPTCKPSCRFQRMAQ